MKEVYIKNIDDTTLLSSTGDIGKYDKLHLKGKNLEVSDGYHTFDELYDHRITLFVELCRAQKTIDMVIDPKFVRWSREVWRSKLHHDGSYYEGWFIMGINKKEGLQITYHLPMSWWETTDFAETLEKAPEFDGHSPADVLERLKKL